MAALRAASTVDDVFLGYPSFRHLGYADRIRSQLSPNLLQAIYQSSCHLPACGPLRRLQSLSNYCANGIDGYLNVNDRLRLFDELDICGERLVAARADAAALQLPEHRSDSVLRDQLLRVQDTQFVGEYLVKGRYEREIPLPLWYAVILEMWLRRQMDHGPV